MPVLGVTSKLEYQVGSSWVAVPGLKTVNLPDIAVTSIDTTHLGLSNFCKTYVAGMIDHGSISFTCEFSENSWTVFHGLLRETSSWRVTAPDDEEVVCTFDAFFTALQAPFEPDAEAIITATLKISGNVSIS